MPVISYSSTSAVDTLSSYEMNASERLAMLVAGGPF
jgi:hypothetical protein